MKPTPDVEVYRAVVPALASGGGMLVSIGSPYRRTGLLHQKYRDHSGHEGNDVLVVQGESRLFNPLLAQEIIKPLSVTIPKLPHRSGTRS